MNVLTPRASKSTIGNKNSMRTAHRPGAVPGHRVAACAIRRSGGGACSAHAKTANLNLTFKDIQGKSVTLSDYKGKVILLDFWATWCPPCRKEIPGFIELYNTYKSRGLVVVGVSMDDADDIADVKRYAAQIKMNYPVLLGAGREERPEAVFRRTPAADVFHHRARWQDLRPA